MPIASTWLDLVVGLDTHVEVVPTPAPTPTPFPHPHCSVIWDPAGYVAAEVTGMLLAAAMGTSVDPGGPVLIGGQMATVTGDAARMPASHIIMPPGTSFATGVTPSDAELLVGSKTVLVRGSNAVRAGEVGLSCSEPVRLPTAQVVSTSSGPNVTMIGGPPALDIGAAAGLLAGKAVRNTWVSKRLHRLVDAVVPKKWQRLRRLVHKSACFFTGHPVNVATGTVSTGATDLALPGAIPLVFAREYDSNWCDRDSPLGFGWSHTLDQKIWLERDRVVVLAEDGRELEFPTAGFADRVMRKGDRAWHPVCRLTLRALGELRWELTGPDGIIREFAPAPGESAGDKDRGMSRLVAIRRRDGNGVQLSYDERARLHHVVDTGGRMVEFEHDDAGRLRRLWVPAQDGRGLRQHAEYRYSPSGDLVDIVDANGKAWRLEYDEHLLVRERDRNGLSFYFQYDGRGRYARCTRTWGDDGIYDHLIGYDRQGLTTVVTNSLGEVTSYAMNGLGLVTAITQPDGTKRQREYDASTWLVAEIDELDQATRYTYDERGNLVMAVAPDRAVTKIRYDEDDRAIELVDPVGATWCWRHDSFGRVQSRIDPLGHPTTYVYEDRELVAVIDAAGARTAFAWDGAGNLVSRTLANGRSTTWRHDALGQIVEVGDANGNVQRWSYDALGRVVGIDQPDGNAHRREYDGEGNLVRAYDRRVDVQLRYVGRGWLAAREIAGTSVGYRHDTEGQLTAVVDEHGTQHCIERDPVGRIHAEVTPDGKRTIYGRDAAGRVIFAIHRDGSRSSFEHDAMGRRTKLAHPDGTLETFAYDKAGRLLEAKNEHARVSFARDVLGRVVAERSERADTSHEDRRAVVVESRRDHLGRRVGLRSSLGAELTIERDSVGDVIRIAQDGKLRAWEARFTRDGLGLEVERALPGGAHSHWLRDGLGLPTQHVFGREGGPVRARRYAWEPGLRLRAILEEGDDREYEHDARGALMRVVGQGGRVEGRFPDAVGNVFATQQQACRDYGPTGELRRIRGADVEFDYDALGRLSHKRAGSGDTWGYQWNGAQRLVQVDRPDGHAVSMAYDALGRRLWKDFRGNKTCFVWDGDVPLHEWTEAAEAPTRTLDRREQSKARSLLDAKAQLHRAFPDAWQPRWAALLEHDAGFERLHAELRDAEASEAPTDAAGPLLTWVFEPGSFAPLARLSADEAHSIVTDHVGAPLAVFDERGNASATFVIDTYGRAQTTGRAELCPFRFAGQYADPETGLHYNRFRHYDPDTGQYVSRDPLGLRAGLRAYAYVDDPTTWSDPLGLAKAAGAGGGCAPSAAPEGGIETPYGPAMQSSAAAAVSARLEVEQGAPLYGIGTLGRSAAGEAQFWSLEDPLGRGFAQRYGIPPENVIAADFIESGSLRPGTPFVTRPAPPVGPNPGGGIEVVVPPGGVALESFSVGAVP